MNKFYRFDLGMLDEEIAQIADHFSVHNPIDVYKENGRMYAEFDACSESEIDARISLLINRTGNRSDALSMGRRRRKFA